MQESMEKKDILIVVDMQNDFITGALGTPEAQAILPAVKARIASFAGDVYFTRDTHGENYAETREGAHLPVPHCMRGSWGWQIAEGIDCTKAAAVFDKPTFGSIALAQTLAARDDMASVTLIGLCTDICVLANAILLTAALPDTPVRVDSACCAGVTPESHARALEAMRMCHVDIL